MRVNVVVGRLSKGAPPTANGVGGPSRGAPFFVLGKVAGGSKGRTLALVVFGRRGDTLRLLFALVLLDSLFFLRVLLVVGLTGATLLSLFLFFTILLRVRSRIWGMWLRVGRITCERGDRRVR